MWKYCSRSKYKKSLPIDVHVSQKILWGMGPPCHLGMKITAHLGTSQEGDEWVLSISDLLYQRSCMIYPNVLLHCPLRSRSLHVNGEVFQHFREPIERGYGVWLFCEQAVHKNKRQLLRGCA